MLGTAPFADSNTPWVFLGTEQHRDVSLLLEKLPKGNMPFKSHTSVVLIPKCSWLHLMLASCTCKHQMSAISCHLPRHESSVTSPKFSQHQTLAQTLPKPMWTWKSGHTIVTQAVCTQEKLQATSKRSDLSLDALAALNSASIYV